MTEELFREDGYLKDCTACVTALTDRGGIVLDRTVFYPTGGGQPGDGGQLIWDGGSLDIATTVKDRDTGQLVHVPAEEGLELPGVGTAVQVALDWDRRHLLMRMHTALHLLCAVVPCGVTGGQIGDKKSRLDFDIGEMTLDKVQITEELNRLISENHQITTNWITDQELDDNPDLVRTMSVQPPRGSGKVRLLEIEGVDLQPCGGTHLASTGEIGDVFVSKIENKGKMNRRFTLRFKSDL